MPVFAYLAKASPTETVRGEMAAESAEALAARLVTMGLYPIDIAAQDAHAVRNGSLLRRNRKPGRAALIFLTRQLANMLDAGMTLHAALQLLITQLPAEAMQPILRDLEARLREGQRFSEACTAWPKVFSKFYVSLLRAGETGGMLELVLDHLAEFLEKEEDVRKQIQAALAYPLLMLVLGMITIGILLAFVVPRLVSMFDEMGQALPLPTRILVAVSSLVAQNWLVLPVVLVVLLMALRRMWRHPGFREKLDHWQLRLPFWNQLLVQAEVAQFARTLGALLSHGVPIHRAFEVVIAACKNLILQRELQQAGEAIRRGGKIGASLAASRHWPAIVGQMLTIAEDTNQLEPVLGKIAAAGTKEVERRVALFTRLLEPAMIILVGAVVGFIVFAMMLPIFQMDFVVQ
ncbi:MAG: type II secretion system F family protein [candidate division KSB1 bacterium]|nr:type II secretion system F family protein [candidate division KSB1 bacterium]MDZ7300445.1 type II secretion system F family protein [candidate division KSB1 bacterium]MDZ7309336.1 type II secretion system F family protein [candidate division KSB1 bacterium]MDZ7351453.1 type II secretion system F family protein [candidate division KSB1 bacterium]MDZ7355812.1 type II secretion system F family protein [candidate division KSB1 bacterium]